MALEKSRKLRDKSAEYTNQLAKCAKEELTEEISNGYRSTVIFAQYECGGGVCIGEYGTIVTCAHCLGDDPQRGIQKIVLFTSGLVCLVESVKVSVVGDIAVLQVIACYDDVSEAFDYDFTMTFPCVEISTTLNINDRLFCIGQPGCDDLESSRKRKTNFPLLETSKGNYQRCLEGDINDNEDIGKLQHNCWTYWGHSGAPLLNKKGELCGLHSSWDSDTGTRHGVHMEAIRNFCS